MKVLIVEDNIDLALSIKDIIRSKGWLADFVSNSEDAEYATKDKSYDIVILDLMLGSKNGIELLKNVREGNLKTPFLILTARDSINDKLAAFNIGADDYLTKPFDMKELLARIEAVVRRTRQSGNSELRCNKMALDTSNFTIQINGKVIPATKKQFLILEKLISNAGRVVTVDQLLSYAWGIDEEPSSFSLRSHIRSIRKLIEDSGCRIKTVYGIGYSIEPIDSKASDKEETSWD